jgi:hypothetical protein
MKYMLGTADARDVTRNTLVSNKLHDLKSQVTHAVDYQLTYIRAFG